MALSKEDFNKFFGRKSFEKKGNYAIKERLHLGKTVFELTNRGISIGFFKTKEKAQKTRDNLITANKIGKSLVKAGWNWLEGKPKTRKRKTKKRRK